MNKSGGKEYFNIPLNITNNGTTDYSVSLLRGLADYSTIINNSTRYNFSSFNTSITWDSVVQVNVNIGGLVQWISVIAGSFTTIQGFCDYMNVNFPICYWGVSGGSLFIVSQSVVTDLQIYYIP